MAANAKDTGDSSLEQYTSNLSSYSYKHLAAEAWSPLALRAQSFGDCQSSLSALDMNDPRSASTGELLAYL